MNKKLDKQLRLTKQSSLELSKLSTKEKEEILLSIAGKLERHKADIIMENNKDIEATKKKGATNAFIDRLTLSEGNFNGMINQLRSVASLEDATGEIIEDRIVGSGIHLQKKRFPLGVVLMIYESRPNVTIDAFGLCFKSGNSVILKGGSESLNTNRILVKYVHEVLRQFDVSEYVVTLLETVTHEEVAEILTRVDLIDVVIPRGSMNLAAAIARNAKMPILYHSAGGARAYIDKSANIHMAIDLVVNAKVQRNSVCNAVDCILIHKDIADKILKNIAEQFQTYGVEIRADKKVRKYIKAKNATQKDYSAEYLDAIVLVKIVEDANEAISFIQKYSHHHTEMLITEDKSIIDRFISEIDAAGLMINCSSRFHDGGEFGLGAEMGTATGKFHARGPVGVRELTTYKWIAYGSGQVKE